MNDVARLRRKLALTQAEFAELLGGLTRQRVSQLEKPDTPIPKPIRQLLEYIEFVHDEAETGDADGQREAI